MKEVKYGLPSFDPWKGFNKLDGEKTAYASKHKAEQQSFLPELPSLMDELKLLERITINPKIFGGKPIIRGRRLAVEHVLGMLAAGDTVETLLEAYPWLEREDVQACLVYARRLVAHERVEPLLLEFQE